MNIHKVNPTRIILVAHSGGEEAMLGWGGENLPYYIIFCGFIQYTLL